MYGKKKHTTTTQPGKITTTKKRDHNITDYYTDHRYKIVEKKDVFLIDTKETYRAHQEKWVNEFF